MHYAWTATTIAAATKNSLTVNTISFLQRWFSSLYFDFISPHQTFNCLWEYTLPVAFFVNHTINVCFGMGVCHMCVKYVCICSLCARQQGIWMAYDRLHTVAWHRFLKRFSVFWRTWLDQENLPSFGWKCVCCETLNAIMSISITFKLKNVYFFTSHQRLIVFLYLQGALRNKPLHTMLSMLQKW